MRVAVAETLRVLGVSCNSTLFWSTRLQTLHFGRASLRLHFHHEAYTSLFSNPTSIPPLFMCPKFILGNVESFFHGRRSRQSELRLVVMFSLPLTANS